jgi:hypothetical protein
MCGGDGDPAAPDAVAVVVMASLERGVAGALQDLRKPVQDAMTVDAALAPLDLRPPRL